MAVAEAIGLSLAKSHTRIHLLVQLGYIRDTVIARRERSSIRTSSSTPSRGEIARVEIRRLEYVSSHCPY